MAEPEPETARDGGDETLDIVRAMIEQAESLPAAPEPVPEAPTELEPEPAEPPAKASFWSFGDWGEDSADSADSADDDWEEDIDAITGSVTPYRILSNDGEEVIEEVNAGKPRRFRKRRRSASGGLFGGLFGLIGRGFSALGGVFLRVGAGFGRLAGTLGGRVWQRVHAFLRRPDATRRIGLALLVAAVLAFPLQVLKLSLLVPLALIIAWASIGSDGLVELVVKWYTKLKARDPDKAETIRARAAAVSRLLNRGIEKLPEDWTRGVYLPDFETDGYVPEKAMVDPFEEFAAQVRAGKRSGRSA